MDIIDSTQRYEKWLRKRLTGGGVYKSVDGAASWVKFNDGLTNQNVRALAIAPASPNKLYAATAAGVFSITDESPTP